MGIVEIIKHLRFVLKFINDLANHIVSEGFDEVVVIDFPGFNLRLIKKLKKLNPGISITYLSPPQLWAWGERRIKTIKKYCDDVIVIYPFEVDWYKARGVEARWLGYPFYEKFRPYFGAKKDENTIALIPGSRLIEIKRLLPLFMKVIQRFKLAHPGVRVVLPLAESVDRKLVEKVLRDSGIGRWGYDIDIVHGEQDKLKALSSCCLALTKPGTVTLELGMLGVPAVVAYKASWLTYVIAKSLVNIKHMSLTNLLLEDEIYPECIQGDCSVKRIYKELDGLYHDCVNDNDKHRSLQGKLGALQDMLG